MNNIITPALIAIAISVLLGCIIILKRRHDFISLIYALLCLSYAYWEFTVLMVYLANSVELAFFWCRADLLWPITASFLTHLLLLSTNKTGFKLSIFNLIFLYSGTFLYALATLLFPDFFYSTPIYNLLNGGWEYGQVSDLAYMLPVIIQAILILYGMLSGFINFKNLNKKQQQMFKFFIAAIILPIIFSALGQIPLILGIALPDISRFNLLMIIACVALPVIQIQPENY